MTIINFQKMDDQIETSFQSICEIDYDICDLIFILDVIKYCDHPRWYEKIPPGGGTSNWRWD